MKNLNVNFENLTDEQQKQLLELVEESQKPKDVLEFERNNDFYSVDGFGGVCVSKWRNDHYDKQRLNFGNAYHTREQAETAAKAMCRYNSILQFAILHGGYREFVPGDDNYYVCLDTEGLNYFWGVIKYSGGFEVYMTKECAELLCEKLNSGEF